MFFTSVGFPFMLKSQISRHNANRELCFIVSGLTRGPHPVSSCSKGNRHVSLIPMNLFLFRLPRVALARGKGAYFRLPSC
jgi:hypothetical protein